MPIRGVCEFCNRDVLTSDRGAFRVRGWEIERDQGGANYIAGKERQANRIVHARCVENAVALEKRGLRNQMSLG
jgi:hypothetical protein